MRCGRPTSREPRTVRQLRRDGHLCGCPRWTWLRAWHVATPTARALSRHGSRGRRLATHAALVRGALRRRRRRYADRARPRSAGSDSITFSIVLVVALEAEELRAGVDLVAVDAGRERRLLELLAGDGLRLGARPAQWGERARRRGRTRRSRRTRRRPTAAARSSWPRRSAARSSAPSCPDRAAPPVRRGRAARGRGGPP